MNAKPKTPIIPYPFKEYDMFDFVLNDWLDIKKFI